MLDSRPLRFGPRNLAEFGSLGLDCPGERQFVSLPPLAHLALLQANLNALPASGRTAEALKRNPDMACLGVLLLSCPRLDPKPLGPIWADRLDEQDFFEVVNRLVRHEDRDHFVLGPLMRLGIGFGLLHAELVELALVNNSGPEMQELAIHPFSLWQQASSVEALVQRLNCWLEPEKELALDDVHRWLMSLADAEAGLPESISVPVVEGVDLEKLSGLLDTAFQSGEVDEAGAERFTTAILGDPPPVPA